MATVINNPGQNDVPERGGSGVIIGVVVAIVVVILVLLFVVPGIRGGSSTGTSAPAASQGGGTDIEVPDQVDVNVKK